MKWILPVLVCLASAEQSVCVDQRLLSRFGEELLFRSGPDATMREQGAFLVQGDDHDVHCVLWPPTFTPNEATYHGPIPMHVVGIIHTHPSDRPFPSYGDRELSTRLHLPVLVITRRWLSVAEANGRQQRLVRGGDFVGRTKQESCPSPGASRHPLPASGARGNGGDG